MSMDINKPTGVVADDGYAYIKLAWFNGPSIKTLAIPSRAKLGAVGVMSLEGKAVGGYEADGSRFTVSEMLDGDNTRFPDYAVSALNRVLVNHALIQAGFGGQAIHLATGLPVRDYFLPNGRKNTALIEAKMANLSKPVVSLGGDALAEIVGQDVFSEALSAWLDYSIRLHGDEIEVLTANGPVGVVDIGGQTTDIAVLLPGNNRDADRSGSERIGVLNIQDRLRGLICAEKGLDDLPGEMIDGALRTGVIRLYGKPVDVRDLVDEACQDTAQQILQAVRIRLGQGADLEKILFVGGGAEVLKHVLRGYPQVETVADPQFANARGMLKALRYVYERCA